MQWWCSWHPPEARNFRKAPLPATVWQSKVGRIGPVAVPIPQQLCKELFLQAPRRTICSCSLDHAGSSVTFQQINLCIFEIKERTDESGEVLWETEGLTIFKLPPVPSRSHKDDWLPEDKGGSCHVYKAYFMAQAQGSHWIPAIALGWIWLSPLSRWESWGSESWRSFPNLILLVRTRFLSTGLIPKPIPFTSTYSLSRTL